MKDDTNSEIVQARLKWMDRLVSWDGHTDREYGHVDDVILSSGTIYLTVTPDDWGHQHVFLEEDVEMEPSNEAT